MYNKNSNSSDFVLLMFFPFQRFAWKKRGNEEMPPFKAYY
jgi:hypothetical protein